MKGFVSEIYINQTLKSIFNQFMGNRRLIYNQLLNILLLYSKKDGIRSFYDNGKEYKISSKQGLQKIIIYLNESYEFLNLSHSQSNQSRSHDLQKRWSNYLNPLMKNFGIPHFKRKKRDINTFFIPNQNNIHIIKNTIYIKPFDTYLKRKLSNKKLLQNYNKINIKNKIPEELIKGKITGIRIKEDKGRYFIRINYEEEKYSHFITEKHLLSYIEYNSKRIIGLDVGLKTKLTDSNGKKYDSIIETQSYKEREKEKRDLQKKLSKIIEKQKKKIINKRIQTGYKSITKKEHEKLLKTRKKNKYRDKIKKDKLKFSILKTDYQLSQKEWKTIYREKQIKPLSKKIRKIELKQKNIRKNENHQISKTIIDNNDIICMENLTFKGMQKVWGNKIKQLSLGQLTMMIKYKAENQGKVFYQIDRFYPSSKTCSFCGNIQSISLKERIYCCKSCGNEMDRDENRSINIKNHGIQSILNTISKEKDLIPSFEIRRT